MLTVADAISDFLAALRSRQAPPNTLRAYTSDLRQFARAIPEELAAVDPQAIRTFLDGNGTQSPATRRRRYATLCSFFRWLMHQELIVANPMERVDPVKAPTRLPRPLDADSAEKILRAIPAHATRDRALFTLLYETGMRVGEALGLHYVDIDLTPDDEKIRVLGKGRRERTVLLTAAPESIRLLRRHLRVSGIRSGAVFRGDPRYGGSNLPLDYTTVRHAWRRYCEQAGVQAIIHQLRHSRASQLVQAGVPLGTIRKLLGHRNLQSTLLYAEVNPQTIKHDLLEYQRRKGKRR